MPGTAHLRPQKGRPGATGQAIAAWHGCFFCQTLWRKRPPKPLLSTPSDDMVRGGDMTKEFATTTPQLLMPPETMYGKSPRQHNGKLTELSVAGLQPGRPPAAQTKGGVGGEAETAELIWKALIGMEERVAGSHQKSSYDRRSRGSGLTWQGAPIKPLGPLTMDW